MDIAIIGTGNVGQALAESFARAGHHVTLAARDPEKTRTVASELGADAAIDPATAVAGADVTILAVPWPALEEAAAGIAEAAGDRIVVDTTNPLLPDLSGQATEGGPSAAERLAEWLPGARIVKAFNTVFAQVQRDPATHGHPVDALVASDDDLAREVVMSLAESVGLRPVDAGSLRRARELEAMAFLGITLQARHGGDWRSAWAIVGAPEASTRTAHPVAA
jgi:hypothetical protein